jgi:hypothetical protein
MPRTTLGQFVVHVGREQRQAGQADVMDHRDSAEQVRSTTPTVADRRSVR